MASKGKCTDTHGHAHPTHKGHNEKSHVQKSVPEVAAKNVTREEAKFIAEHADELSKTAQRAKWVHSPREHEDRPGQSLATRSHEVIEHWAEERGAMPATVPGIEHDDHAGVLRFNFPDFRRTGTRGDRLGHVVQELRRSRAGVRVSGTQVRRGAE